MASYEQHPNKTWSVRFRINDWNGVANKRLSGYRTKKEAEQAYVDFMATWIPADKPREDITFRQVYTVYIGYAQSRMKESSFYEVKRKIENHILSYFADTPMKEITPAEVLQWQKTLDKYSYKYKTNLRGFISAIFKFGGMYYDTDNPLAKVQPFRRIEPKKKMEIWEYEEFCTFIDEVEDKEYKAFFSFLYLTGCRKGEAFALTWADIDLDKRTAVIDKSITRKVEGKA